MPSEIDVQFHADKIRDDGFTVIEHAAEPGLVEGLKAALERTERDHNLGYAKTSFEGFKTVRINNLLTYDDLFWEVPLHDERAAGGRARARQGVPAVVVLSRWCSDPGRRRSRSTRTPSSFRCRVRTSRSPSMRSGRCRISGTTTARRGSCRAATNTIPRRNTASDYDAVTATMPAGSVMLFDSALWHGGGANVSDERRYAFSCAYCWGWMRQQENLQLGIPRETAQRFPRQAAGVMRLQRLQGTVRPHRQPRSDRTARPRARQAHGVGSRRDAPKTGAACRSQAVR